ncbi:MAG: hypothetical protein ACOX0R_01805 [Candidatus Dojkabacteria bacterium]|jgi:hypothetical protein
MSEEYKEKIVAELKEELKQHPVKFGEFRLKLTLSSLRSYFFFPLETDFNIKEIRRCGKNWAVLLQRNLEKGLEFTDALYECCGLACGTESRKLLAYASVFLYLCWKGPVSSWKLATLTMEHFGEGYLD